MTLAGVINSDQAETERETTMTDTIDKVKEFEWRLNIKEKQFGWLKIDITPIQPGCDVCLTVHEGWGTSTVYCELTMIEARRLAYLLEKAIAALESDDNALARKMRETNTAAPSYARSASPCR